MTYGPSINNSQRSRGIKTGIGIILATICIGCTGIYLLQNAFTRQASSEATGYFAARTEAAIVPTPTITPSPVRVSIQDVCQFKGQRVIVQGRLNVPVITTFCYGNRCEIRLMADDGSNGQVDIQIRQGQDPNQMEPLPEEYTDTDLRVHTHEGQTVGAGDLVDVIGVVIYQDCGIQVDTISIP